MKFQLAGVPEFKRALNTHLKQLGTAYSRGVKIAATDLLEFSRPLAPIDTGALQASGIMISQNTGWRTVVWVGFGADVPAFERVPREYAVYQHEVSPYARHWLQNTAEAMEGIIIDIIAQEMRGA